MKSNHGLSPREVTNGAAPDSAGSSSHPHPLDLPLNHHVASYETAYNRTLLACLSSFMLCSQDTLSNTPLPPRTTGFVIISFLFYQFCYRVCLSVYLAAEKSVTPPTIHVNLHIQSNRLFTVCLCGQILENILIRQGNQKLRQETKFRFRT